ncbi:MAG TPA: hypothetical protein VEG33_17890 [Streptosporangiaceae bacterium]|nr:hypothetical protein [Streptosporangiaceae bacterium]
MIRLLDARTGSPAEVRPAQPGVLRICAHVPGADAGSGLTALRVLLAADLLARVAELGGLQVLTALAADDPAAAPAAALERDTGALGIHPPTARTTSRDAPSSLGGPIDVHFVTRDGLDPRLDGLPAVVDTAYQRWAGGRTGAASGGGGVTGGAGRDPLAVRLALMSFPISLAAGVTGEALDRAGETLGSWRRQVAQWAESPSRPIPTPVAEAARAAFSDLDTAAALALLRGLPPDASVPAGAKFETFVYADRILGLDLAREVGR